MCTLISGMADQYISTLAAHGLPGSGLDIPATAIGYGINRRPKDHLQEASIFCTALKPPRDSSRPEMSAADWTIKINPRAGIKFFPFQSNWDRGIEIYDF